MESFFSVHGAVHIMIISVHQAVHKKTVALCRMVWSVAIRGVAQGCTSYFHWRIVKGFSQQHWILPCKNYIHSMIPDLKEYHCSSSKCNIQHCICQL